MQVGCFGDPRRASSTPVSTTTASARAVAPPYAARSARSSRSISSSEHGPGGEGEGPQEIEWIRSALGAAPVLGSLKPEQLEQIVDDAKAQQALTGETIIAQGATGETFFIVGTGTYEVEVRKDGKLVKVVHGEGDSFERASRLRMIDRAARWATVTCTSEGWLWAVEGAAFREVMVQQGIARASHSVRAS